VTDPILELRDIQACRDRLGDKVIETPVAAWRGPKLTARVAAGTQVAIKLELFQHTGSFKVRGALNVIQSLSAAELARGVTAVSAGNHAIATAYAAAAARTSAKVVMMASANPARVARARAYGAEVVFAKDVAHAFETVEAIARDEGRAFVHPFEGPLTAQGAGTVGLEFARQAGALDAVIIPIGGGGLCGGMASAIKQLQPACKVFGVEPEGADTMRRSFAAGEPVRIPAVNTIADSLAPPMSLPYSFALCRRHVDDIVLVSDQALRDTMRLLFDEMKLAVEPAGAASAAALLGPLRDTLKGARVGLIACGANIDLATFTAQAGAGAPTDAEV
jgi:threonine dehydratase